MLPPAPLLLPKSTYSQPDHPTFPEHTTTLPNEIRNCLVSIYPCATCILLCALLDQGSQEIVDRSDQPSAGVKWLDA